MEEKIAIVNEIIKECRQHRFCAEPKNVCPYWNIHTGCCFVNGETEAGTAPQQW